MLNWIDSKWLATDLVEEPMVLRCSCSSAWSDGMTRSSDSSGHQSAIAPWNQQWTYEGQCLRQPCKEQSH